MHIYLYTICVAFLSSRTLSVFEPPSPSVWPKGLCFKPQRDLLLPPQHQWLFIPPVPPPSPKCVSGCEAMPHVTLKQDHNCRSQMKESFKLILRQRPNVNKYIRKKTTTIISTNETLPKGKWWIHWFCRQCWYFRVNAILPVFIKIHSLHVCITYRSTWMYYVQALMSVLCSEQSNKNIYFYCLPGSSTCVYFMLLINISFLNSRFFFYNNIDIPIWPTLDGQAWPSFCKAWLEAYKSKPTVFIGHAKL